MPYCRNCGSQLQEADNFCETCGTARRGIISPASSTGKTCPFCQFPLKADSDVTICSACGIPHHLECWVENGGCTTFGCRGLAGETEIQSGTFQPTNTAEAGQSAGERQEASIDENPVRQVEGLASPSMGVAVDTGHWESRQSNYQLTYQTGELSLQDLPIGARVIDPSWEWEFREDMNYTGSGEKKPVVWIVVAKNHYDGLEPHVTLLTEELIGRYAFDESKNNLGMIIGKNSWETSGTATAARGLRPWLNSTGYLGDAGFYKAYSDNFKNAMLATNLSNKEWGNSVTHTTIDNVFIPSTTELGEINRYNSSEIGSTFTYFLNINDARRCAHLFGRPRWYWTRSPSITCVRSVCYVSERGKLNNYRQVLIST